MIGKECSVMMRKPAEYRGDPRDGPEFTAKNVRRWLAKLSVPCHLRTRLAVNSGPLSERMWSGAPRSANSQVGSSSTYSLVRGRDEPVGHDDPRRYRLHEVMPAQYGGERDHGVDHDQHFARRRRASGAGERCPGAVRDLVCCSAFR